MPKTQRGVSDLVAMAVSVMVLYRNLGKSDRTTELMRDEVEKIAAEVLWLGGDASVIRAAIFEGLEAELLARYDPNIADRLHAAFVSAFGVLGVLNLRQA